MSYLVIDIETSGLPKFDKPADDPCQPHVAAIALIFADEDLRIEREWAALIRPDGWTMELDASVLNGLTDDHLAREGIPILEALPQYTDAIDAGRIVVAHNAQFDCKMMRAELRRAGMDDRFERTKNICTMRACVGVVKAPPTNSMMAAGRKTFKAPKLGEAYRHFFKRDIEGAHSALIDARACLGIFRKLKEIGCAPEAAVFYAKEGTKAGAALKARQGESAEEPTP